MASPAPAPQPATPPQGGLPGLDDFYVPAFRVTVGGRSRPQLLQDVSSVTFTDSLAAIDAVDLQLNNYFVPEAGQAGQGQYRYSDGKDLDPFQELSLDMGYYRSGKAELARMMTGQIVTLSPTFPASGYTTVAVRALSLLHQFRTQQKTRAFHDLKDSEIAQQLVADIDKDLRKKLPQIRLRLDPQQLQANLRREQKIPYLEMHAQYPIIFLYQRSRDLGYDIGVTDDVNPDTGLRVVTFGYGSSADVLRPVYQLEWGRSLVSFNPTLQTANQVNAVTVRGWNVQAKKKIEETATRADLVQAREKIVSPEDLAVVEGALAQKLEVVVDRPFRDAKEARDVARQTLRQIAQGLVEAKGRTIGLPELRAGCKVDVAGLGARFSGRYQVTGTTHSIGDGGYTTDFTARMEARLQG